jgi:tight adherence protein B
MAKPTIMSELQIDILLLFIISFSATMLLYLFYIEYKRIKHIKYIKSVISLNDEDNVDLLKNTNNDESKTFKSKINSIILRTGFNISMYVFVFICIVFVLIIGFLFSLFLNHWSGFIIGIPFGMLLFSMFISSVIAKRKRVFNRALATAISVLVKMMKNGIGFEQALVKSISVSNSKIFKDIFNNFLQEKNAIGETEAFHNLNKFVHSKELRIFALAIKIGRASGGQFSNTLEKVEKTISYRKKMQEKVDIVTREGSVGSYIVVGISIFLYFALNGNFDGKLHQYFMESEYGRFQLLGIFLWIFLGMMVNKLITKVDK